MRGVWILTLAAFATVGGAFAQPQGGKTPAAGTPQLEVKGKIERIQFARGQGMPSLEVSTREGKVMVLLGSLRYLMEQDFNPRAGEEVVVKGYKVNEVLVAVTVSLSATGKIVRLRDDSGRPVWMRGRYGPPMNRPAR